MQMDIVMVKKMVIIKEGGKKEETGRSCNTKEPNSSGGDLKIFHLDSLKPDMTFVHDLILQDLKITTKKDNSLPACIILKFSC